MRLHNQKERAMTYEADYVVVGAGAAGSVVAARLAEDGTRSVILLEAGPDSTADSTIAVAAAASVPSSLMSRNAL